MATKLTQETVNDRENYMKGLFRVEPNLTMTKAVERFRKHFGVKMRPQRVYALRKVVRAELKKTTAVEATANRAPTQNLELVRVGAGMEGLAWDIMSMLASKGLMTGRPFEKGNGYVVLEMP